MRSTTFLLLISFFFITASSSSFVNCPSSMSSRLLIIFAISLFIILGGFPNWFLKCSFHSWGFSSRLAAFSFAFGVLFLSFTLFTVCYENLDYPSSTGFLILLIWPWISSNCFLCELISSLRYLLNFQTLTVVRFILLFKDAFLKFYLVFP